MKSGLDAMPLFLLDDLLINLDLNFEKSCGEHANVLIVIVI